MHISRVSELLQMSVSKILYTVLTLPIHYTRNCNVPKTITVNADYFLKDSINSYCPRDIAIPCIMYIAIEH